MKMNVVIEIRNAMPEDSTAITVNLAPRTEERAANLRQLIKAKLAGNSEPLLSLRTY